MCFLCKLLVLPAFAFATAVAPARAQERTPPISTAADTASAPSNRELARRLDLLARELDDLKLGPVAGAPESHYGLGPAASKVYGLDRGVSIGGYGEVLYRHDDPDAGPATDRVDYLRQIVYVGFKYDERLLFNSEIEFEHASTELGGSVSVEFGYIDALLRPEINLRAGLLLVPMGFLNELHEPPVFLGTQRPETELRIIPSTWRANGVGFFGEPTPGLTYRAYGIESLNAAKFEPSGLREARQNGAESNLDNVAGVLRADFERRGVRLGGSLFRGNTAQGARTPAGDRFEAATTVYDAHLQVRHSGVRLRALVGGARVDEAEKVDALLGIAPSDTTQSVASDLLGWYVEAGYDLLSRLAPASRFEIVPYVRYEAIDTQREVPAGFTPDAHQDQKIVTVGAAFYPHPQVVVKGDFRRLKDEADSEVKQWSVALGYLF